jgi:hypothetical protein
VDSNRVSVQSAAFKALSDAPTPIKAGELMLGAGGAISVAGAALNLWSLPPHASDPPVISWLLWSVLLCGIGVFAWGAISLILWTVQGGIRSVQVVRTNAGGLVPHIRVTVERGPEGERVATRAFKDLEDQQLRGSMIWRWRPRWTEARAELITTGRSVRERLAAYDPSAPSTESSGELAVNVIQWVEKYWKTRQWMWQMPDWTMPRVQDAISQAPSTNRQDWKRFWLKHIDTALVWLEKHDA